MTNPNFRNSLKWGDPDRKLAAMASTYQTRHTWRGGLLVLASFTLAFCIAVAILTVVV